MPKYLVTLSMPIVHETRVLVEADDEDSATELAFEKFEEDRGDLEWTPTMDLEDEVMLDYVEEYDG